MRKGAGREFGNKTRQAFIRGGALGFSTPRNFYVFASRATIMSIIIEIVYCS